ncbi:M60 family peptidase N-terminal accessory domain-containing protein, partial [Streptomyces sp. B1866]|uniref:M60 family peptidase N-terminal accessory domain-containing protein n=1 Tax=Streptomyces sp. B1866 TaxID=3075431 RepID=UPI002890429E
MMENATECLPADVKLAASREFRCTPASEAERKRLGLWFKRSDAQPTGAYAKAGEAFEIKVIGGPAGATLEAVVGTYGYGGFIQKDTEEPRTYKLSRGPNEIRDAVGGVVWIRAVSDGESAVQGSTSIEITGSGIQRIPVYRQGETRPADWPQMLEDSEMKGERSPVQLVGEHTVLTVWRASALAN